MAKGIDEEIEGIHVEWEGYAGKRVEEFIKKTLNSKVGHIVRTQEKQADNNYHIYGFASEEAYNEWNTDPDNNSELLLTDIALPDTGGGGSSAVSYIVNLYTDSPSNIVTTDNVVKLRIRFTSEEYNPITQTTQPTTEGGTLTVQTRLNSSSAWQTRGTIENISSIPSTSTDEWSTIDISHLLSNGTQQVRILVKGDTTELNTRYLQFTVTKTSLALTFATQWEKPITDGVMRLSYYISGAVSKTLHIRIDGKRDIERNISTAVYTETPLQIDITDTPSDMVKVLEHGIHEIEAWLTVNDSTVQSQHVISQVLVYTDSEDRTPKLLLNNVKTQLTNWTTEHILSYAIYNPNGESTPLKFVLQDYSGEENYFTLDVGNVPSGVQYDLRNVIEIDSEETTVEAYMRFFSGDSEIHSMIGFEVDNSENFSPTLNPDFVLNPRTRTNEETDPETIINHATGEIVPSTWKGFGLRTDGWVTDNEGQRCLRIPASHSVDIDYESFTGFIGTDKQASLTVEIDFKTTNATDMNTPVLRMCSYREDGGAQGFEMKPTQSALMTQDKRDYDDQDVMYQEGERTHVALNILYHINGTSQNYVRIFINGIINREFLWDTNDEFVQFVNGVRTSQGIRIGSDHSDIDIYGIRIYKKALSAGDIRQDYMASLPTVALKQAFRDANDILNDSNLISYSKTREKFNTIVVTGSVPSYSTGNVKTTTTLRVETLGDPEHSGTMNDMETSGQGTSSRSYWKWNFQWKFKDTSRFINDLGEDKGAAFALDSTVPEATKLVAKLNWASSQQSHKMGSCNLFNDLWKKCVGGNSITTTPGFEKCRVSVKQKPYFLFVRASEEEEPVFYGLYTFGPGKGDKPTFGYDKKVCPDYLMIEGCDNGEPLTNHRIPWNTDITIGGDEDELINYNGRKQWEIDMGNSDSLTVFRNAFNFIYENTPHIKPFVGTLAQLQASTELQANRQTLYWVTQASGTSSARYDLYRFDELTQQWVDAGVNKIAEGQYVKLNLSTQTGVVPSSVLWDEINQQFINARVTKFKNGAANYFNLPDAWFCQMFLKFIGASDNRAKNTYMYLAEKDGQLKIHFAQDDLDTIFSTDNVGRKNKPYYVEEHDRDADGGTYWNGEENALYDLMELAFESDMRAMMNSILTQMQNSSSDNSLMGCMNDYYFSTQKYFPAVAYNEVARLLYEQAAQKWDTGEYVASTHPLTQSLGDQLQGEMQWVKLRLIYMSSFASYGAFAMNGEGALTWRSATTTTGIPPAYSFNLTPHIWLYPAVTSGSSTTFGRGNAAPKRVPAGETFLLDGVAADNDTNIQLHGIHYYVNIGQFGNKSLTGSFTVAGERLTEFIASATPMEFRPSTVIVTAPNLRKFDIKGASTVVGSINFNVQTRLEQVDLRGTSLSSFAIAEPTIIKELHLPATLTSLRLLNYTSLTQDNFTIEDAAKIQSLEFSNCPNLNSQEIVASMCEAEDNKLAECKVDNVNWTNFSIAYLLKLAAIKADLRGRISLATSPTFDEKRALLEAFGNIDDPSNKLYVEYTKVYLTSFELTGDSYYGETGQYKLVIIPNSTRANNFTKMEWSISSNNYATIDPVTGLITVSRIGTENTKPSATVTLKITTADGSSVANTLTIWFYSRSCQVGDYVYADGSYSDLLNKNKTPVGICFYINPQNKSQRLCVSLEALTTYQWGLSSNNWSEGIALADTTGYSVFDIPALTNMTTGNGTTLNVANYRDETSTGDGDGFKIQAAGTALGELGWEELTSDLGGYPTGTKLPWGLINTLKIIAHRNTILSDSNINLPKPQKVENQSELSNLMRLMQDVVDKNSGHVKYREFYYPAASQCNTYEPGVGAGETLADCFKAGKWFLPSVGELARIYWWHSHNLLQESVTNGIFSKHIAEGRFTALGTLVYWASNESSAPNAWYIGFSSGYLYSTGGKNNVYAVRAVVAF